MAGALFLDTRTSPGASPSHRWISGGAAFGASACYLFLGDAGVWWWAHLAGVAAASLILVYGRIDPKRSLIIALPMAGFPTVAALLGKLAGGGLEDGSLGIYVLLGAGLLFSLALGAFRGRSGFSYRSRGSQDLRRTGGDGPDPGGGLSFGLVGVGVDRIRDRGG